MSDHSAFEAGLDDVLMRLLNELGQLRYRNTAYENAC